ncbi:putative disease resistance protein RGA3 [Tasmannia lanceolata]|uniref:putative disease resistance protein RGA3 n=1 Tax=Tasmannia lanceolata TaxID=3420 RepID=UPI0040633CAE
MADAVVCNVLEKLDCMLQQQEEDRVEVRMRGSLLKELRMLSTAFTEIRSKLSWAENIQVREEAIRERVRDIKHEAYSADDIVTPLLVSSSSSSSRISRDNNKVCSTLSLSRCFYYYFDLGINTRLHKIKHIRERLDCLGSELDERPVPREVICVDELDMLIYAKERMNSIWFQIKSGFRSVASEHEYIGRDGDKECIINMLFRGSSSIGEEGFALISIVGMEGLGKTALAQLVYHSNRVGCHFQERIWVYAPTDEISQSLIENLAGKCFLLVLDNVLYENCHKWSQVSRALGRQGMRGSRILVTTRSDKVARTIGSYNIHYLHPLKEDVC